MPPSADLTVLQRENEQLRRAVAELSMLNDLAAAIGRAEGAEAVMQTVIQRSARATQAEQGVITLIDEAEGSDEMQTLVRTVVTNTPGLRHRPDQHLLGWMTHHKRPLALNDPATDPRFRHAGWSDDVRSLLSVPLMVQGRLIGILTVYNKRTDTGTGTGFGTADQRLLTILSSQAAQVIANRRLREERARVLQVFGQHTAPAVVEALLARGAEVPTERRQVCVMFLDIRSYTAFAEQRSPEAVVDYLNTLFDFMIALVNAHHGIIHQLLGDGFMALFGAPISHGNDRANAVAAAQAILHRLDAEIAARHIPETRIGIGLHAGEVVAGTVGSAIHKEYKVTGDVVNLAARIEGLTKTYDAQLLASEAVVQALPVLPAEAEDLGPVAIRGRTEPVRLYRLT